MTDEERYIRDRATVMAIIKYTLIFLIIAVCVFFSTKVVAIMMPFLIGFLIAKSSYTLSEKLCKVLPGNYTSVKRKKVSKIIYAVLVVLIFAILGVALFLAILQAFNAIKSLTSYVTNFDYSAIDFNILDKVASNTSLFLTPDIISSLEDAMIGVMTKIFNSIPNILKSAISNVISVAGNLPYAFFFVVCTILSGSYFLTDPSGILRIYSKTIPSRTFRKKLLHLLDELSVALFQALGGYLALLIITALESFVVFTIAGVKYSVILAIVTSIVDFLPVLGTSAVMIPVIIYDVIHANYVGAIIITIGLAAMTFIRRIIEPLILGKSMKVHPLIMLISMAVGVYIWGLTGFLIGPTVFIIIMTIFKVFGFGKQLRTFLTSLFDKVIPKDEPTPPKKKNIIEKLTTMKKKK